MSDDDSRNRCGCDDDGVAVSGSGDKKKRKCACRGSESFERWKSEMLDNGNTKKEPGGKSRAKDSKIDCSCFKNSKKNKKDSDQCGCTCCGFFFCAAALIALGVGAAWVKKKYID